MKKDFDNVMIEVSDPEVDVKFFFGCFYHGDDKENPYHVFMDEKMIGSYETMKDALNHIEFLIHRNCMVELQRITVNGCLCK